MFHLVLRQKRGKKQPQIFICIRDNSLISGISIALKHLKLRFFQKITFAQSLLFRSARATRMAAAN